MWGDYVPLTVSRHEKKKMLLTKIFKDLSFSGLLKLPYTNSVKRKSEKEIKISAGRSGNVSF